MGLGDWGTLARGIPIAKWAWELPLVLDEPMVGGSLYPNRQGELPWGRSGYPLQGRNPRAFSTKGHLGHFFEDFLFRVSFCGPNLEGTCKVHGDLAAASAKGAVCTLVKPLWGGTLPCLS